MQLFYHNLARENITRVDRQRARIHRSNEACSCDYFAGNEKHGSFRRQQLREFELST